jgi:cytochrome c
VAILLCAEQSRSIWDGVYTRAQAERGEELYGARCADCHGDDLEGDVVEAPALCGSEFLWKWNGSTLDLLFVRVHRDMPLTKAGTLTRQQAADLVAFMLRRSDVPEGKSELPTDAPSLRQIRMEAERRR